MRIFLYECVCAGGLGFDVPPSLLREGHAMLAAVVEDFKRLPGVETVTLIAKEWGIRLGDKRRRTQVDSELWSFLNAAASSEWTLVIAPEFDDLLWSHSQTVLDEGRRLLGSAPKAITLTGDKLALAEFWRVRGVRHPWTDSLGRRDLKRLALPVVLKPRHGAGSLETYLLQHPEAATAIADGYDDEFIVQEYIPGQPASVALLIGKAQTIALAPARQHLSSDGRFRYEGGSLPLPAGLAARATRLALQAVAGIDGLQGYVGVDLALGDDGIDYAIEINPRLTTSYLGLRQLCKQNLAELILQCAEGRTIEAPTWHKHEVRFSIASAEANR